MQTSYPENPVVARIWRGGEIESVHRGAWVVVDTDGRILAGAGRHDAPYFVRSAVKAIQALPLIESGAAAQLELTDSEIALAVASHSGEPCHTETVSALLARLRFSQAQLQCGAQVPLDPKVRFQLRQRDDPPSTLHNECSGKHAGFLALSRHLGEAPENYLHPKSETQGLVRRALAELMDQDEADLRPAVDGCSAPTYRVPLEGLARGFARVTNPGGLGKGRAAACERITAAVAAHPELVAGNYKRLCTALLRATGGRLFPKIGAEAIYAVGEIGGDRALAVKLDDGQHRGLFAMVISLLEHFRFLRKGELEALRAWRDPILRNRAGLEVGRIQTILEPSRSGTSNLGEPVP